MFLALNHTAATRGGGIGERRIGLPRHDSEVLFLLALECGSLDGERRGAAGAALRGPGEGHRVFVVGDEADDLELMLCCWRITAVRRTGERSDLGCIVGLPTAGDLVGDGYEIRCRKTYVAAQGIGAKGIGFDKRGRFVVPPAAYLASSCSLMAACFSTL